MPDGSSVPVTTCHGPAGVSTRGSVASWLSVAGTRRQGGPRLRRSGPAEAHVAAAGFQELVEVALGLLAAVAVALLDTADELVVVAFGHRQVVVRELAPLLLDVALELLPVALQNVPVHGELLPW